MRSVTKIVAVVVVAGVIVFLAIHFSGPKSSTGQLPGQLGTETTSTETVPNPPKQATTSIKTSNPISNPAQPANTTTQQTTPAVPAADTGMITDWEQKIDEALASAKTEAETGRQLLALLPRMPDEGKVAAAEHI